MKKFLLNDAENQPSLPLSKDLPKIKRGLHLCSIPCFLSRIIQSGQKFHTSYKDNIIIRFHNDRNKTISIKKEKKEILKYFQAYRCRNDRLFATIVHPTANIVTLSTELFDQFSTLTHVDLSFTHSFIVSNHIFSVILSKISRHFSTLQFLALRFKSFHHLHIDNQFLKRMGSELSHLVNLKSLILEFEGTEYFEDEGFRGLVNPIYRHLVQLNSLEIKFQAGVSMSDKSLEAFGLKHFSSLQGLESLALFFNASPNFTDEGFKMFVANLDKQLIGLRKLKLHFPGCRITNKGLQMLVANIAEHLRSLKYLELGFGSCNEIDDEGLDAIGTELSARKVPWQKLILGFESCNFVEYGPKDELKRTLEEFIQDVTINSYNA